MPCAADATRTAAAGAAGFGPGYGDSQAGIFHFKILKALSWGYRGYKPLGCVCVCACARVLCKEVFWGLRLIRLNDETRIL